jgi:hypothetical protein
MSSRWFKRIKRFMEIFTPGGTEYTPSGIAIVFSRTGHWHVPESEYQKLLFQYLDGTLGVPSHLREQPKEEN